MAPSPAPARRPVRPDHEVLIVGAGFSGLCAGIMLRRAGARGGPRDFVIVDAAPSVGGVWRHNTYPGVAVDVPSATYSYSFEPNPGWTRTFAPGAEVRAYAEHCADEYGLRPHLRLNTRVERAVFDEDADVWRVTTDRGELTARFVIGAVGPLDQPKNPDIPGLEDFAGTVLHTARWDHAHDLTGRRVAVIGTGASGLQVVPELAGRAAQLDVYQRTPIWVFPKVDVPIARPVRALFRTFPPAQRLVRLVTAAASEAIMVLGIVHYSKAPFLVRAVEGICRAHLRRQVPDRALRRRLTPRYGFGCKRPSFSNRYFPAFNRPDVELVTDPIERITEHGIVTRDGTERPVDTLVLATGFKVLEIGAMPAFPVVGLGGVELGAWWDEHRYQNYEGLSVPIAPNFWLMNGPYTVTGASWFSIIEAGATHAVRCILEARRRRARRMTVKQGPHDAFTAEMRRRMKGTILAQPSCARSNSYYFDRHGDSPYVRPQSGLHVWRRARTFDLDDYAYRL
ncbi:flavin-containing monooxygenase [Actinomadura atramentaria]|uniref:flavin-containing monooxygenase n=1 Tax=Actinomadura atramentaria TaxID=1990 RepID=UPI000686E37D|nr:NAD(P)/FAD-dependent oxidoreductase [Actinomadura atramentaria]